VGSGACAAGAGRAALPVGPLPAGRPTGGGALGARARRRRRRPSRRGAPGGKTGLPARFPWGAPRARARRGQDGQGISASRLWRGQCRRSLPCAWREAGARRADEKADLAGRARPPA